MSLEAANREVYGLLKEGIKVSVPDRERGGQKAERLRVMDWEHPSNNDFLAVRQMSFTGPLYTCRPDLVGFVNGLALVLLEFKQPGVPARAAYDENIRSYKHPQNGIPALFAFNGLLIASNGTESRVGSLTADWERFYWTFVVGTDRVELDDQIATTFKATGAVSQAEGDQCHATSGAHLRELLRGNHRYVFTLIHKFQPDRGSPTRSPAAMPPAGRVADPRSEGQMPVLSDRPDVIVLADEAHRSQYDTLALNMRAALPRAIFIAFTGTPLLAGEERTKEVFGDYVSIYDFQQSVEDGATVPLFYENRTPELQLVNPDLNEDIYSLIESAELDPDQEAKLERELSRQYHILTRDDRLETVAQDIVRHFLGRGFVGKAMVVSIDKATALKMHDKGRKHWAAERERVEREIRQLAPVQGAPLMETVTEEKFRELRQRLEVLTSTEMAVIVSPGQNEIEQMAGLGLDIVPHRVRMNDSQPPLDEKFKDTQDPLRLVFVCAMWLTGFDAPSCSTVYLDKPMRNHSLMQAIARANRVFPGKHSGMLTWLQAEWEELLTGVMDLTAQCSPEAGARREKLGPDDGLGRRRFDFWELWYPFRRFAGNSLGSSLNVAHQLSSSGLCRTWFSTN